MNLSIATFNAKPSRLDFTIVMILTVYIKAPYRKMMRTAHYLPLTVAYTFTTFFSLSTNIGFSFVTICSVFCSCFVSGLGELPCHLNHLFHTQIKKHDYCRRNHQFEQVRTVFFHFFLFINIVNNPTILLAIDTFFDKIGVNEDKYIDF